LQVSKNRRHEASTEPRLLQLAIIGRVGSLLARLGDERGPHLQLERFDRIALALIESDDVVLTDVRRQKAITQALPSPSDGLQINANVDGIRYRRSDRHRRHAVRRVSLHRGVDMLAGDRNQMRPLLSQMLVIAVLSSLTVTEIIAAAFSTPPGGRGGRLPPGDPMEDCQTRSPD
jgi:hypothetical protein